MAGLAASLRIRSTPPSLCFTIFTPCMQPEISYCRQARRNSPLSQSSWATSAHARGWSGCRPDSALSLPIISAAASPDSGYNGCATGEVRIQWMLLRSAAYLKALYHRHVMKWGGYRSPARQEEVKAFIVVAHALPVIISLARPGHRPESRGRRGRSPISAIRASSTTACTNCSRRPSGPNAQPAQPTLRGQDVAGPVHQLHQQLVQPQPRHVRKGPGRRPRPATAARSSSPARWPVSRLTARGWPGRAAGGQTGQSAAGSRWGH
jgi:hypothetical protein